MLGRIKNARTANMLNTVQAAALAAAIAYFNIYSLVLSDSNHTGFPVHMFAYVLLGLFFINLGELGAMKRRAAPGVKKWLLVLAVILSMSGAMNVSLFESKNVMMQYGHWVEKGMPEKPEIFQLRGRR